MSESEIPVRSVTFFFTDVEGSTRLWERYPDAMRAALARHDLLLREAIGTHNGLVFKTVGDAVCAVFDSAPDALTAALDAQSALTREAWGETGPLRVRIALHSGPAEPRDGDYFGPTLNRIARLVGVAHGGQIILSAATRALLPDKLPDGLALADQGEHRLRDLAAPERVFAASRPGLPADFPPLRSLDAARNNLPQQLTSFVGRTQEARDLKARLATTRLLTLTGAGGCGKTRLALQVGAERLDQYPQGVWLAELAAIGDAALVTQTVAGVFHVREEPGVPLLDSLTQYLRGQTLLLLLDNCEHLVEASAALAHRLLRQCPNLSVLATSREALGIAGETVVNVPTLALPDMENLPGLTDLARCDPVRLFVERAIAGQPAFEMNAQNARTVAGICTRLDGIPLAIELAAARVKALSVEQISDRLDDRFRLLTGGSRTALPRQQTLRALMDWSYNLLTPEEQTLLRRLSIFAGDWTLEAAEALGADTNSDAGAGGELAAGEVLEVLMRVVDKSLVVVEAEVVKNANVAEANGGAAARDGQTQDAEARYRLLETVREYGREKLDAAGETERLRARHRDWFLRFAETARAQLAGREQAVWLARLEREHENLRAALHASREDADRGGDSLLRLAVALFGFWYMRGHLTEGRKWLDEALARCPPDARPLLRAQALNAAGILTRDQSDLATAEALHRESLALFEREGDAMGLASALHNLGRIACDRGDHAEARALFDRSLAIKRDRDDARGVALTLSCLAISANWDGRSEEAQTLATESLEGFRALEDAWGIATTLNILGYAAYCLGDDDASRRVATEALARETTLGNRRGMALAQYTLALAALRQDGDARDWLGKALTGFHELGDRWGVANALETVSELAVTQDDFAQAARLSGAAQKIRKAIRAPLTAEDQRARDARLARARQALGERAFEAAWAEGERLEFGALVALALRVVSPQRAFSPLLSPSLSVPILPDPASPDTISPDPISFASQEAL